MVEANARPHSATSMPIGFVSLQDDLCIPPPPPVSSPPAKLETRQDGSLAAELQRRFQEIFGTMSHASAAKGSEADEHFEAKTFFFYGPLMDPDSAQQVLGLEKTPIMTRAKLKDFKTKMHGSLPALIPAAASHTNGMVWKVETKEQLSLLSEYETKALKIIPCEVVTDDGDLLSDCRTFCWNGDPESADLREGSFNLEGNLKELKAAAKSARSGA